MFTQQINYALQAWHCNRQEPNPSLPKPSCARPANGYRRPIRRTASSSQKIGRWLHFRCWARYLFISNIVTLSLPKTALSLSSAMISRLFASF